MFKAPIVTTGLLGLVGFRQPFNPALPILDAANLTTTSGLIVNSMPFAKIEYLYDSQDYANISDTEFNTYLQNIQEQSILNVCNAVFDKGSYIDKQILYKNAFNKVDTETLTDGFVGFKIQVSSEKDIAFTIKRILLDFEGAGDIELLLFNTSQKSPIQTKVITIGSDHVVDELNWVVDNSGDTYKGDYYLGYLTDYINIGTLKPYDKDHNSGNIMSVITYLGITRVRLPNMTTNILPDLDDFKGMSETNGLNPDITVYNDYTELIVNNDFLFSTAIQYDMQISIMDEVANSIRSNKNQRMGKDSLVRIKAEIEGLKTDTVNITGVRPILMGEISKIKKEILETEEAYFGGRVMVDTMV